MSPAPTAGRSFAVVTGSSSGIGLELARQFAGHHFDVLLCAEDDGLETAAAGVRSEHHDATITTLRADLASDDGPAALVRHVEATGRPVDALALNAGVGNAGRFLDTGLSGDLTLIRVNIVAVVQLAKQLLPAMVARGSGRLLITGSVAGTMPGPFYATYAASKAFLNSFAEAVRYELTDTGVTVTVLMPGPTDTGFFDRAGMQGTPAAEGPKDDPAQVAAAGFEALMAGKDSVAASTLKDKAMAVGAKLLPDRAAAALQAKLTEPKDG
ncbi:SDR family NAD(P)-dependent oxidoreductase [Nakamurella leprariae]|uniref:SDR family NAD(P)-dependent oxidoreductase n=1 Tax=Nakamurella leprariae TaxID=2803911 RepID=A0A938YG27_9ACTN|nr:SDR family NAD(P)-dependent oxidoreductase [Nakamurella leprariae]MBM9468928.1 SDR family NAD(P)-dependent oxidoreductase [Nakamurella leprariae]